MMMTTSREEIRHQMQEEELTLLSSTAEFGPISFLWYLLKCEPISIREMWLVAHRISGPITVKTVDMGLLWRHRMRKAMVSNEKSRGRAPPSFP